MTVERPDWNFDNSGNAVVPAAPSPDQVIHEMQTQSGPSPETTRALAETTPASSTAPVPAARDASGNIVREDWGKKPPTVYAAPERKNFSGLPDWGQARNEHGRFVTALEGELRQVWSEEGGYEVNRDRVLSVEHTMLSLSENPAALQTAMNELPNAIQLKAANIMRLSTGYGPNGGVMKLIQFEDSLTSSEQQQFKEWFAKLGEADQNAIIAGFIK
jgi:hypothetical protein